MNKELYSQAYELINNLLCIRWELTLWCEIECELEIRSNEYTPTTYYVLSKEKNKYRVMEPWVGSIIISKNDIDYIKGHPPTLSDCHNAIIKFIEKYAWDSEKVNVKMEMLALNWDYDNSFLRGQSDETLELFISFLTP